LDLNLILKCGGIGSPATVEPHVIDGLNSCLLIDVNPLGTLETTNAIDRHPPFWVEVFIKCTTRFINIDYSFFLAWQENHFHFNFDINCFLLMGTTKFNQCALLSRKPEV